MKKIFSYNLILLATCLFVVPITVYATYGACSSHLGVNCNAGADYDGSAICNDGWRDSLVSFSNTSECKKDNTCVTPASVKLVYTTLTNLWIDDLSTIISEKDALKSDLISQQNNLDYYNNFFNKYLEDKKKYDLAGLLRKQDALVASGASSKDIDENEYQIAIARKAVSDFENAYFTFSPQMQCAKDNIENINAYYSTLDKIQKDLESKQIKPKTVSGDKITPKIEEKKNTAPTNILSSSPVIVATSSPVISTSSPKIQTEKATSINENIIVPQQKNNQSFFDKIINFFKKFKFWK